jgi:hypothetical protein
LGEAKAGDRFEPQAPNARIAQKMPFMDGH